MGKRISEESLNSTMKSCTRCKKVLPKLDFFIFKKGADGRSCYCRRCESSIKKEARLNNPELVAKHRERSRKWYGENKERKQLVAKRWRTTSYEKIRDTNLKKRFNISQEDFNNKLIEQNYKCAICGINDKELKATMSVDHDHATGLIRGLLCSKCNIGLGHFKDNIKALKKAIDYLEIYSEEVEGFILTEI